MERCLPAGDSCTHIQWLLIRALEKTENPFHPGTWPSVIALGNRLRCRKYRWNETRGVNSWLRSYFVRKQRIKATFTRHNIRTWGLALLRLKSMYSAKWNGRIMTKQHSCRFLIHYETQVCGVNPSIFWGPGWRCWVPLATPEFTTEIGVETTHGVMVTPIVDVSHFL